MTTAASIAVNAALEVSAITVFSFTLKISH
jgi:hypothetical protein